MIGGRGEFGRRIEIVGVNGVRGMKWGEWRKKCEGYVDSIGEG